MLMRKRGNAWWLQRKSGGKYISRQDQITKNIERTRSEYEQYAISLSLELLDMFEDDDVFLFEFQTFMIAQGSVEPTIFYKAFRDWCIERKYVDDCPDCDGKLLKMGNSQCETCEGRGYLVRKAGEILFDC